VIWVFDNVHDEGRIGGLCHVPVEARVTRLLDLVGLCVSSEGDQNDPFAEQIPQVLRDRVTTDAGQTYVNNRNRRSGFSCLLYGSLPIEANDHVMALEAKTRREAFSSVSFVLAY
jgi:hypothetical protein